MSTVARVLAYVLGVAVAALVVILALAGVTAAIALVVTAIVLVALIAMGSLMGGGRRPSLPPAPWPPGGPAGVEPLPADRGDEQPPADPGAVAKEGDGGGTMGG